MILYFLAVLTLANPQVDEGFQLPPPDPIVEQVGAVPNFTPTERCIAECTLFCADCLTCAGHIDPIGCYD